MNEFIHHFVWVNGLLFYMREKGVNLNTAILSAITALLIFGGKELYSEMRQSHDSMIALKIDVLDIKNNMVSRAQYDLDMAQMRTRMSSIESRNSQNDIEIQKLKNK